MAETPKCECLACVSVNKYAFPLSFSCCPRGLRHGAMCTCGVTVTAKGFTMHPAPAAPSVGEPEPTCAQCGGPVRRFDFIGRPDVYECERCKLPGMIPPSQAMLDDLVRVLALGATAKGTYLTPEQSAALRSSLEEARKDSALLADAVYVARGALVNDAVMEAFSRMDNVLAIADRIIHEPRMSAQSAAEWVWGDDERPAENAHFDAPAPPISLVANDLPDLQSRAPSPRDEP